MQLTNHFPTATYGTLFWEKQDDFWIGHAIAKNNRCTIRVDENIKNIFEHHKFKHEYGKKFSVIIDGKVRAFYKVVAQFLVDHKYAAKNTIHPANGDDLDFRLCNYGYSIRSRIDKDFYLG